jgi:4-amino-4-deoxy-L-arabinose transferase-like glycosyltransferase
LRKKRKIFLTIGFIFLLAVFLRTFNIRQTLLFHFDQGYHGLAVKQIWDEKKLTLLGHKTDTEGIFHSSLFYYSMLPLYLISSWDPAGVSTILAMLDAVSVIFIFLAAKKLFDYKTAVVSSLVYAVSYSAISYARWLSNVTLIPLFMSIAIYFLVRSEGKYVKFFALAVFFEAIAAQFNGAIGFFMLPVFLVFFMVNRKKLVLSVSNIATYSGAFLLPLTPLVIFDIRNNFLVTKSILNLFLEGKNTKFNVGGIYANLVVIWNYLVSFATHKAAIVFCLILLLFLFALGRKKEHLGKTFVAILLGLFLTISLLAYYQGIQGFFLVGVSPLLALLIGWALVHRYKEGLVRCVSILLFVFLILLNLCLWRGFLRPQHNLIPIGTRNVITLEDREKALDFIYKKADGKPFKAIIYIIPYFQEQPWDYLFSWDGVKTYG